MDQQQDTGDNMPRIPVYNSNVKEIVSPSVSLQSRGSTATAAEFGAIVGKSRIDDGARFERYGQAGMALSNSVMVREQAEKAKYDNAFAREKEVEVNNTFREWRRDQSSKFKGGDAKGMYDKQKKMSKELYKKSSEGMDKDQLRLFNPAFNSASQSAYAWADAYEAKEIDNYYNSQLSSSIIAREDRALSEEDPWELAKISIDNELDIKSLYKGYSTEYINEKIQNSTDRISAGKIDVYLDGSTEGTTRAWAYYKKHASEMSNKAKEVVLPKLEAASLDNHIKNQTEILEQNENYTYEEKLEKAKTLKVSGANDDDLRKGVAKQLRANDIARRQRKQIKDNQKFDDAVDLILDAKGGTNEGTNEEIYQKLEKHIDDNFRGRHREGLLSRIRAKFRGSGSSRTDIGTYIELSEMIRENPENFKGLDIERNYGHLLSDGDTKSFIKIQIALKNNTPAFSIDSRITNSYNQMGDRVNPRDKETYEPFRLYKNAVETRIKSDEIKLNRNLSTDEIEIIIKDEQLNHKLRKIEAGEIRRTPNQRGWSFGYGPDKDIETVLKDPTGLPDVDDDEVRAQIVKEIADEKEFKVNDFTVRLAARHRLGGKLTKELKEMLLQYKVK